MQVQQIITFTYSPDNMKKILLITFLVVAAFEGHSQFVIQRTFGTNTVNDPRFMASINLFPPRYSDTTSANLSIGIDTCGAHIFTYGDNAWWLRACNPKRWIRVLKTTDNDFIKNQSTSQQNARLWTDSGRLGNLSISPRVGGGQPTLYSTNLIWLIPQQNRVIHSSIGAGAADYPIWQFTTFNANQPNTKIGAILAFNFNGTGTSSKEFLITTSGFGGANLEGGNMRIATGEVWNGSAFTGARKIADFDIVLDPCANGEVQVTKVLNAQMGLVIGDSTSSSTTLTITTAAAFWFFTGSSPATWSLPTLSGNRGFTFWIKNIGSDDIILTAGANQIYSSSATTVFNITPGQGYVVHNNGTYWIITTN